MAAEPDKGYPAEVVRGTFFEHDVPIKDLFVHFRTEPGGYARPLRQWRVNKLIAEWDRQALGVLLLSMRDNGCMAIIDGQHRVEAAKVMGLDAVDAMVYIDLTLEDEARLYRKFGDYLKQTALDRFHAGVAEHKPEYLAIQRILTGHQLHVPNSLSGATGSVDAVDALVRVSMIYGLEILDDTLALLHDAWLHEHRAYRAMCITGTAAFLARFGISPRYRRSRLINRMKRQGIGGIETSAFKIKDANLATNPTAGWGMALLTGHDFNLPEDQRLGDWPRRHVTEQAHQALSANIKRVNANKTPEQRSAAAKKSRDTLGPDGMSAKAVRAATTRRGYSHRAVECPYCHAPAGKPCKSNTGNWIPGVHNDRRDASKAWAESKLKP